MFKKKRVPEYEEQVQTKVKHTPANDYIMREGVVLPLPIEDEELVERQMEQNKKQKEKSIEERAAKLAMLKEEIAYPEEYVYDPNDNYYEGMPIRDDLEIIGDPSGYGLDSEKKGRRREPAGALAKRFLLPFFDIRVVKPGYTITACGRRGSGKSFFLRWLLYHVRRVFPYGLCFTRTKLNGFWSKFIPDRFIHEDLNDAVIAEFMAEQSERIQEANAHPELGINTQVFLIFEDCADQNMRYNPSLDKLFYMGRHFNAFVLIVTQYLTLLAPGVRSNTDLLVLFSMQSAREIEHAQEQWFSAIPKHQFPPFLRANTGKRKIDGQTRHFFLAKDNRNPEGMCEADTMFTGFATEVPDFVLGSKEYWGDEVPEMHRKLLEKGRNLKKGAKTLP